MDALVAKYPCLDDGDLRLCVSHGVAYQTDMTQLTPYDDVYFNKCLSYEDQPIAISINRDRIALVNRYVGQARVLDVGIGSGEFIRKRNHATFGFDVNKKAVEWLKKRCCYSNEFHAFNAFTFWDVLEHVPTPATYLMQMRIGSYLFVSVPIFYNLKRIRESRHYRPNEHLYYFTKNGFIDYMACYGFVLLAIKTFEMAAGRDSIYTFVLRRDGDGK